MREIVRASGWAGFRELVEELGGDADEVLAAAHVDAAALANPERYMPLKALIDSQAIAAERLGRPDFGLMFGTQQDLSMLGALYLAIANSATARQSIEICGRYLHLHNPALTMTLAPVPRTTREFLDMHLDLRRPARLEQNSERMLSSIHKALRQLGGESYRPYQVWFTHAPVSPLTVYSETFGVVPKFNRPRMGISMERAVLDSWRPGSSPQLRHIAETYLRQLSAPSDRTFTTRVAGVARSLLRGRECTPEQAAMVLGVHPRTLQRRLQAEGASFEKIKDDMRREIAESLLVQPRVSLSQIALMLDYADLSTFSRTCRRWFNEAPSTVRKRLLSGKPPAPAAREPRVSSLAATLRAKSRLGST